LTCLPDRDRTWAVLVATADHDPGSTLTSMPHAIAGATDLCETLSGTTGLFDANQVKTVCNPKSGEDVLAVLDQIAGQKPDAVLFYYIGHGMTSSLTGGEYGPQSLFLALTGSVDTKNEPIRTGLPVGSVLSRLHALEARQTIAVLDCCFSGLAMEDPAAGDTHLLCATDRVTHALYDQAEEYTGFTKCLLRLLREGIPDGPEYLDLYTLFQRLTVELATTPSQVSELPNGGHPYPRQRTTDGLGSLALARNPAFGTATTSTGLAARAEFARRVAALGHDPSLLTTKQRMYAAYAAELFAALAEDRANP
jgi:uncharacterized caspase-like protein